MKLLTQTCAREEPVSTRRLLAIRQVMRLFVEDDLARGISPSLRYYCHACREYQPAAGFMHCGTYQLCNACATTYELACAQGELQELEQFVRGA